MDQTHHIPLKVEVVRFNLDDVKSTDGSWSIDSDSYPNGFSMDDIRPMEYANLAASMLTSSSTTTKYNG